MCNLRKQSRISVVHFFVVTNLIQDWKTLKQKVFLFLTTIFHRQLDAGIR